MVAKEDALIASLARLGLSTYESKAYLAAVGQPPMTCYRLAQRSGVPRARIYEVAEKLAAKGLLIFRSGDRTLLVAANHERFIGQKESEARQDFDRLRKSLSALPRAESTGIWNIEGRTAVLQTAQDLMAAASRYIYLEALADDVRELLPGVNKARQRKVEIHGVYCGVLDRTPPGLVRHLGDSTSTCSEIALVVDGEQALIGCTQPADSASAAMTQNKGVVHVAREYIRHEVFLNSLLGGGDPSAEAQYVRRYRSTMRRLP